jgi:hypothetical protein
VLDSIAAPSIYECFTFIISVSYVHLQPIQSYPIFMNAVLHRIIILVGPQHWFSGNIGSNGNNGCIMHQAMHKCLLYFTRLTFEMNMNLPMKSDDKKGEQNSSSLSS